MGYGVETLWHQVWPRAAIKGQVLADLIAAGPPTQCNLLDGWVLNVDKASNNKGSEIGTVFITPEGSITEQSFTLGFPSTNNEAEYEAVIVGLKMAVTHGLNRLEVHCDSLLVVSQVKGEYTAKDERMAAYLQLILSLKSKFL